MPQITPIAANSSHPRLLTRPAYVSYGPSPGELDAAAGAELDTATDAELDTAAGAELDAVAPGAGVGSPPPAGGVPPPDPRLEPGLRMGPAAVPPLASVPSLAVPLASVSFLAVPLAPGRPGPAREPAGWPPAGPAGPGAARSAHRGGGPCAPARAGRPAAATPANDGWLEPRGGWMTRMDTPDS